ncbi:MAG TPA: class I poly(R)-hydroxyalkanoic acid synthase [Hyphomicrobiales bacterium]|nr:class I poly(R)-hydroxyalkanoic acid synthase [Hyphomicrobiales bacterium]
MADDQPHRDFRPDIEAFAENATRLLAEAGKAWTAWLAPRMEAEPELPDGAGDMVRTLGEVAARWVGDPVRLAEAQRRYGEDFVRLWGATLKRLAGEDAAPVAAPEPRDSRFRDPRWSEEPLFDFLKQLYLLTAGWAENLVAEAEGLDPHTRAKAAYYLKQVSAALSPSNFVLTNPELLSLTLDAKGANLVRGMGRLAEDLAAGGGALRLRQTDAAPFRLGETVATTPGKVVFRNELFELIQYAPATAKVRSRPVVIVPPWINKYYVLDLTPEKSFVRWMVEQELTVFVVSWVNPDAALAGKTFEDYMQSGVLAALDQALAITRADKADLLGYCVGGTLVAATLAYLAAAGGADRVGSATLMAAQVDFTEAGELAVFVDPEQLAALEERMAKAGYLAGTDMAATFNTLRPDELIWPYVVSNYLKGETPRSFDLLFWNSDATHLPAANHAFYLRNCYLENRLAKGEMEIGGVRLDVGKVKTPIYSLATREDHIAPAGSVFRGSALFGGPVRFVLGGSGHIVGVVNPPAKGKYQYWTGEAPKGALEDWLAGAKETAGSWWPDWRAWLDLQDRRRVKARRPGGRHPVLGDAPGDYVKVRV